MRKNSLLLFLTLSQYLYNYKVFDFAKKRIRLGDGNVFKGINVISIDILSICIKYDTGIRKCSDTF